MVTKQRLGIGHQLARDGFEIVGDVLTVEECNALASELSHLQELKAQSSKSKIGGLRNLLRISPRIAELASSAKVWNLVKSRTTCDLFPVRAIFFDKTPGANWLVAWHQDLTIAVAEKVETPEYTAWSVKEGIFHVQPPRAILEGMLTLRLHLDDCTVDNGALKVVPGSHLSGKLGTEKISRSKCGSGCVTCEMSKGAAMLMRPLLLHSSSPSAKPSHRRVLHIEYATDNLPNGLKWFERP